MAKVLEVKYENLADARVCEVAYESQADLRVFRWRMQSKLAGARWGMRSRASWPDDAEHA